MLHGQLNRTVIIQYAARNKKLRANGYASYDEYLRSPEWKAIRAKAKSRPDTYGKCYVCESTESINLHHFKYGGIGKANLGGIRPLCRSCHEQTHHLTTGPGKLSLKTATKRLRKRWLKAVYQ